MEHLKSINDTFEWAMDVLRDFHADTYIPLAAYTNRPTSSFLADVLEPVMRVGSPANQDAIDSAHALVDGWAKGTTSYIDACLGTMHLCCGYMLLARGFAETGDLLDAYEYVAQGNYYIGCLIALDWESFACNASVADQANDLIREMEATFNCCIRPPDPSDSFYEFVIKPFEGDTLTVDKVRADALWDDVATAWVKEPLDDKLLSMLVLKAVTTKARIALALSNQGRPYFALLRLAEAKEFAGYIAGSAWGSEAHKISMRVQQSTRLNDARHRENRDMKKVGLEFYDLHRHSFKSDKDIAEHIAQQIVPVDVDTIRKKWLPKHKRDKK